MIAQVEGHPAGAGREQARVSAAWARMPVLMGRVEKGVPLTDSRHWAGIALLAEEIARQARRAEARCAEVEAVVRRARGSQLALVTVEREPETSCPACHRMGVGSVCWCCHSRKDVVVLAGRFY